MKSESVKSVRSARSFKSLDKSREFEVALNEACEKYNCTYTVHVTRDFQRDGLLTEADVPVKYKKIKVEPPPRSVTTLHLEGRKRDPISATTVTTNATVDSNALLITAVYDNTQKLVEIILNKIKSVPRTLMQIMCLIFPPHDRLTKISFNRCIIDAYVLYELNKIISISAITDLNFDRTFFPGEYLKDLLDNKNAVIKNLSLCGCEINDETCKEIASRLHFSKPAEKTLMVLNLSSNRITDEGARHLGEALRTNRHLRYLNLADNRIADEGADSIFNSLTEFLMTVDEVIDKRKCTLEYVKAKRMLFINFFSGLKTEKRSELSKKSKRSPSTSSLHSKVINKKDKDSGKELKESIVSSKSDDNKTKAEKLSSEEIGTFLHPFAQNNIKVIEDSCYCLGNMVLCYLNLSYNHLTYLSVQKLMSVMQYQKSIKKSNQIGLIKIVIEGNHLPIACNEYQIINDLTRIAKSNVTYGGRRPSVASVRRSRIMIQPTTTTNITKNK